jgi:predicted enzyme related to lactoylglutathione lyase
MVIDAADPSRLARFWAAALGWEIAADQDGEVSWTVLADPEGSEFCVLSPL